VVRAYEQGYCGFPIVVKRLASHPIGKTASAQTQVRVNSKTSRQQHFDPIKRRDSPPVQATTIGTDLISCWSICFLCLSHLCEDFSLLPLISFISSIRLRQVRNHGVPFRPSVALPAEIDEDVHRYQEFIRFRQGTSSEC
jgi:hypothetical protein